MAKNLSPVNSVICSSDKKVLSKHICLSIQETSHSSAHIATILLSRAKLLNYIFGLTQGRSLINVANVIISQHIQVIWELIKRPIPDACLRIVDVRGIMACACAKQWGAHAQGKSLRMCKAMACAGDGSCKWGNQGNRVRMRKAIVCAYAKQLVAHAQDKEWCITCN